MSTTSMTVDQQISTHRGATAVAVLAAVVPTVLSAQGMIAVARDTIGLPLGFAVGCAAFLELGLVASALLARASVRRGGHAGADGTATWALSAISGCLSALHEVAGREVNGPHLLAAMVRLVAPLVAAWLWHRVLVADLEASEPRPTRAQARRDRLMLAVASAAAEVERAGEGTGARARAERRLRARNRALLRHVPGTDATREEELRAWMASVGQTDIMPAWTRAVPRHEAQDPDTIPDMPGPEDPTPGHRADMPGHDPDMPAPDARPTPACPDIPALMPGHDPACPGMSALAPGYEELCPGTAEEDGAGMPAPEVEVVPAAETMPGQDAPCPGMPEDVPAPDARPTPACPDADIAQVNAVSPDMPAPMPGHEEPMSEQDPDMPGLMPGHEEPCPGMAEEDGAGMPAPEVEVVPAAAPMPGHGPDMPGLMPGQDELCPGMAEEDGAGMPAPMSGEDETGDVARVRAGLRARLADELVAEHPEATATDLADLWQARGAGEANVRTCRRHLADARDRAAAASSAESPRLALV